MKYLLLDHYGEDRFFFCDPDFYPIPRGDEQEKATRGLPGHPERHRRVRRDSERTGLEPPFSDEAKLRIYREHKRLQAIPLTPATADSFTYSMQLGTEGEGRRVTGTIRTDGAIVEERSEAVLLTCPICLAEGTRIETPQGPVPVEDLRAAMPVWTFDADGNRIAAPVLRTARSRVPIGHTVVHLQLADGRTLTASAGHPTTDGRTLGALSADDTLDGGIVLHAESMPYAGDHVYDILPSGATGNYRAGGILLNSTLR